MYNIRSYRACLPARPLRSALRQAPVILAATLAMMCAGRALACPYAAAGYPDGCSTAPVTGAFKMGTFATYARQSGQVWKKAHPQPWAVAGVDYAVGYSKKTVAGMYPLVKPDLAKAGGAASGANLPFTTASNGCVYSATGNPNIPGAPAIVCRGTLPANGKGAYAGQAVISGIDFSADSAGNCVQLYIDVTVAETVYVVNNNFKKGATCYSPTAVSTDALLDVIASPVSLVLKNNVFNGMAPYQTDVSSLVLMNGQGTIDAEYNAFLNPGSRPVTGDARGGWTLKYNYMDGMTLAAAAPHGEIAGTFPNPDFTTIAYQDLEFNTAVWGANSVGVGGINAAAFISGGGNGQTVNVGVVNNNTFVSNLEYGGKVSSGKALLSVEVPFVGSLTVQNNYVDPSGAYLCMQVEGDEIGISGYIDDGQGPGGAYDGVPGNVLHVTARAGKDFILIGAALIQPSGTDLPANLIVAGAAGMDCNGAMVTGATNSIATQAPTYDTYCLSGPPVAVAAFSGAQTMPQIQSATVAGNIDLIDGSAITQGANAQWNNGACNGRGRYTPHV